jgi:hypothetical protein
MQNLHQLALGLGLLTGGLLAACGGNNNETGREAATAPPSQPAAQPAGPDSIHTFSVEDFQQLSIPKQLLGPLEASNTTDLRVVIRSTKDYSPENKVFAEAVAKRLELLLNTQVFHDLVVSQTYHSSWDNNMTPEQIYARLMQGDEGKHNIEDGVVDLQLQQDSRCPKGKIGYRQPPSPIIHTYKCRIDETRTQSGLTDLRLAELGGHYIHEYLHVLGFGHSYTNPEQSSVPYRIGNLVKQLAENGVIIRGKIQPNLTFRTNKIYVGEYKNFKLYESHYGEAALKPVRDLARYKGKWVRINFQLYDDKALYSATIIK